MDKKTITVVTVDDHALIREAIRTRLERDSEITLVGEGTRGEQVLPLVEAHRPDVLLLDLWMPQYADEGRGDFPYLDTITALVRLYPHTKIIILSQDDRPEVVAEVIRIGIQGYLMKGDASSLHLAEAVKKVNAGEVVFSSTIVEMRSRQNFPL
jgi:DNA-binding NarL/FixJ family response regulator